MYQAIVDTLTADATLTALLPGGIHSDVVEVSRQNTPSAFDANKELLPSALVKPGITRPDGPFVHSAAQTVEIYLYQRQGFDVIEQAARRIYELLHNQRFQPVNDFSGWLVKNTFTNIGLEDNALNCSLGLLRYQALTMKNGG